MEWYIFNNSDKVIVLKDYIFYTSYYDNKAQGSYLITRSNQEVKKLDKLIDFEQNQYRGYTRLNNCIFLEIDGEEKYFTYAQISDNKINLHRLSVEYPKVVAGWYPMSSYSILNETDMFVVIL